MREIAGDTPEDRSLWNTYLYLARKEVKQNLNARPLQMEIAQVDDPGNRVADNIARALQTIIFSSFRWNIDLNVRSSFLIFLFVNMIR